LRQLAIAKEIARVIDLFKGQSVYTRFFCVRFSVPDGATAQLLPLLFTYVIAREKQRKQLGSGAIADKETDAKNASVDGP
jgi:hypothetical protein